MKYRYLFVGDRFWGDEPATPELLADLLLVDHPELPMAFSIHSSHRNTLESLFQNCPRDIIGRQAGTTLLCVGWEDLSGSLPTEKILDHYMHLVHEIRHNCQTSLILCTLPSMQFPQNSIAGEKTKALNQLIRDITQTDLLRIIDLDALFQAYQSRQMARGDLIRNLFTDNSTLGTLGQMLCARLLANELAPS